MTVLISILSGLTADDVQTIPFAHLVREKVFPDDIYARLAAGFPPPERFLAGMGDVPSNQAIRIPAVDVVDNPAYDPLWREFFAYHTSNEFWQDILRVMGPGIRQAHPNLEGMFGKRLEDFKTVRRGSDEVGDIMLDTLFVINTPVTTESSVRPAHVDAKDEVYAALLYMRDSGDQTPGGDLSLYHFKGKPRYGGHYAELSDVIEDKTVPYGANRLAAFVNSAASLHGVTPRPPTPKYRRYINIVGKTGRDVFSLPRLPLHRQIRFWLERRKTKKAGRMAARQDY